MWYVIYSRSGPEQKNLASLSQILLLISEFRDVAGVPVKSQKQWGQPEGCLDRKRSIKTVTERLIDGFYYFHLLDQQHCKSVNKCPK